MKRREWCSFIASVFMFVVAAVAMFRDEWAKATFFIVAAYRALDASHGDES